MAGSYGRRSDGVVLVTVLLRRVCVKGMCLCVKGVCLCEDMCLCERYVVTPLLCVLSPDWLCVHGTKFVMVLLLLAMIPSILLRTQRLVPCFDISRC